MEKIIGYQIESADGKHNIPDSFYSWEIFKRKKTAKKWLTDNKIIHPGNWKIETIRAGDIEEHSYINLKPAN